jgi:hypothetical protein
MHDCVATRVGTEEWRKQREWEGGHDQWLESPSARTCAICMTPLGSTNRRGSGETDVAARARYDWASWHAIGSVSFVERVMLQGLSASTGLANGLQWREAGGDWWVGRAVAVQLAGGTGMMKNKSDSLYPFFHNIKIEVGPRKTARDFRNIGENS